MNPSENVQNQSLTVRQKRAIPYIIASPSIEAACREGKITKQSYYLWMKNQAFRAEVKRRREEVMEAAMDTLKSNINRSVDVLVTLLDSANENTKRHAANNIIEYVFKSKEIHDFEARLTALEEALGIKAL